MEAEKKRRFQVTTNKDRELHSAIMRHYTAMGASMWPHEQFLRLCETLKCKPRTLATLCGVEVHSSIKTWKKGIPCPVSLTLAVIKQFIDFKITGVLGKPIIPLDAIIQSQRISHLRKYRRREKRRTKRRTEAKEREIYLKNREKRAAQMHYGAKL